MAEINKASLLKLRTAKSSPLANWELGYLIYSLQACTVDGPREEGQAELTDELGAPDCREPWEHLNIRIGLKSMLGVEVGNSEFHRCW